MGVDCDQNTDFQPIFNILLPKCFAPEPPGGGGAYDAPDPSWEMLGRTLAEGPTEWRGPGPRDPTIRH